MMEQQFIQAWRASRAAAGKLGLRLRPIEEATAMATAHRCVSSHRVSDGFSVLADKGHLELSLEALVTDRRFTALFTDAEANEALNRLLAAGYYGK